MYENKNPFIQRILLVLLSICVIVLFIKVQSLEKKIFDDRPEYFIKHDKRVVYIDENLYLCIWDEDNQKWHKLTSFMLTNPYEM